MLRCSVTSELEEVVCTARIAFSKRSWPFVLTMAVPWLMCAGQRSVRRMAAMGGLRRSISSYYRFLSDGKWRLPLLTRSLFLLIVSTFKIRELTLVLDDTLCPKWGRHIYGTSSFFDHVKRPRAGYIWGHNWIVLAAVVRAGERAWVALPFWIGLYRSAACAAMLACDRQTRRVDRRTSAAANPSWEFGFQRLGRWRDLDRLSNCSAWPSTARASLSCCANSKRTGRHCVAS